MWTLSGFSDEISSDLLEQVQVVRGLGMDWIEFRSAWGVNVLDLDAEQLAEASRVLEEAGVRVSSIGSPIGKISITEDFAPHLERMRHAADVAAHFDAPYIRIFSFFLPEGDDPAIHRDEVMRRMRSLADVAEEREVTLLHENEKHIYGDIPSRCVDILETVGSPRLRAAWDAANFVQVGVRPVTEGFAALRPHLEYVQIKDARLEDGEVVTSGRGDGEMREFLAAIRDDGFDGYFSLEPHLSKTFATGGFSGPDLFREAHGAFTGLLDELGIQYR